MENYKKGTLAFCWRNFLSPKINVTDLKTIIFCPNSSRFGDIESLLSISNSRRWTFDKGTHAPYSNLLFKRIKSLKIRYEQLRSLNSRLWSGTKYTTELECLSCAFFLACSVLRAVTGRDSEVEMVVLTASRAIRYIQHSETVLRLLRWALKNFDHLGNNGHSQNQITLNF